MTNLHSVYHVYLNNSLSRCYYLWKVQGLNAGNCTTARIEVKGKVTTDNLVIKRQAEKLDWMLSHALSYLFNVTFPPELLWVPISLVIGVPKYYADSAWKKQGMFAGSINVSIFYLNPQNDIMPACWNICQWSLLEAILGHQLSVKASALYWVHNRCCCSLLFVQPLSISYWAQHNKAGSDYSYDEE